MTKPEQTLKMIRVMVETAQRELKAAKEEIKKLQEQLEALSSN